MVALATAFVRLRLDVSQAKDDVDRGLRRAGGEKAAEAKGRSISASFSKGFEGGGSTFGRVAATMAARATLAASAVAAATPAVTQFVAALAPAAGVGAALPAVLGSIATVSVAAKVGIKGVGDAITTGFGPNAKKADQALQSLHGNARIFAKGIIGLRKPLDDIQRRTSNRLFGPLLNEIKPLGQVYLPILRTQLPQTAGALGRLAEKVAQYGRQGPAVHAVNALFDAGQGAVKRLTAAVGPLITGLSQGLSSTTPFVGQLAGYLTQAAINFGHFLSQAAKAGTFQRWISNGIDTIKTLIAIIANLGAISRAVFGELTGGSGALLIKIRGLTSTFRDFVTSAEGSTAIKNLFEVLNTLGAALRQTLIGIFPQIVASLRIAGPAAAQFATALSGILINLGPLLPALTGIGVQLLTALIPAMNSFAGWLARNQGLVTGIAPVLIGFAVATRAVAVATTVASLAVKEWSVVVGIAKAAQVGWNAIMWLSVAPMKAEEAITKLSTSTMGTWIGVKRIEAASWLESTTGAIRDTAAKVANRVASAVGWVNAFIAVKLAEVSAWTATTAAAIANRVATLASAAAQKVAAAATVVWTAVTAEATLALDAAKFGMLGLSAAMRANPIGAIITIITLLVAAVIYAYKHFGWFRSIVDGAWKGIKIAAEFVWNWMKTVLWPSLQRAVQQAGAVFSWLWTNVIRPVWGFIRAYIATEVKVILGIFNGVKYFITVILPAAFQLGKNLISNAIRTVRNFINTEITGIRIILDRLRTFITVTLPNGFVAGVNAIRAAWGKVQEAARKPVSFVVNSVINPLIGGYNKIAKLFGAPEAATIKGFEEGGKIPGPPSSKDNRWGSIVNRAGKAIAPLKVATGEFIVNARDTAKALPLLRWINSGMRGGPDTATKFIGRSPADMPGDGSEGFAFAKGGLVGFLGDVWGAISNPAKLIKGPIEAAISQIPGSGAFRQLIVGLAHKLLGGLMNFAGTGGVSGTAGGTVNAVKARAFVQSQQGKPYIWASAGPNGYDCSGIVSAAYNVMKGRSPYNHTFSTGSLPGPWFDTSRKIGTLTAGWSHPGQSPAGSVGHMAGMIAGLPFESTGSSGVRIGARARKVTQFANIGVARATGGLINANALRLMDRGGAWPSGTLGANLSGHDEQVLTGGPNGDIAELKDILTAILGALRSLAPEIAVALERPTRRAVQLGRGRGTGVTTGGTA
jgi:hypothetical protein